MMADMGSIAAAVLGWLLTYAVHSTILLGGAALLTARLIRADAWRETVWRAALLGAVLTATLQSGLGLRPFAGEWRIALRGSEPTVPTEQVNRSRPGGAALDGLASGAGRAEADPGAEVRSDRLAGAAIGDRAAPEISAPIETNAAIETAAATGTSAGAETGTGMANPADAVRPTQAVGPPGGPAPAPAWPQVLLAVWAGGALLLLVRLAYRQLRLLRLLRDRHPVTEGNVLSVLAALRRNAGVWRPVDLTASLTCPGPLALGRSEICVPERFLRDLDPDQQRSALAHELAHLARRDPVWHLVTGLVEAAFFFQPLNRMARVRLREVAENLSDDWAVRQTGSALGLARCLAEVASWVGRGAGPVPSGTMAMAEGGSPLLLRVERLLGDRTVHVPGGWLRSAAAAGLVLLVWIAAPVVSAGAVEAEGRQSQATPLDPDGRVAAAPGSGITAVDPLAAGSVSGYPAAAYSSAQRAGAGAASAGTRARLQDQVIRHPEPGEPLQSRWQWAAAEAARRSASNYWVAYAFERMLPSDQIHVEDSGRWSTDEFDDMPLGALIYGPSYERPADAIAAGPPNQPQKASGLVRQPVVVLFHMVQMRAGEPRVGRVSVRTASAGMNLRGAPVYWLGAAADAESFDWLRGRIQDLQDRRLRGTVIEAMAMHADAQRVVPFLEGVVTSDRSSDVREEAVEGLAWHPTDRSVALLRATALDDRSGSIREEATETLGELRTPAAAAALDELLRTARSDEVRAEAVEALAQRQQPEVLETLTRVALDDPDRDIQEEAIEAIASFPAASAVPVLDRIARTHPRADLQSEAVEALGEVDPAAAADVLEQLLQADAPAELRDEAIDVLAERRSPEALAAIFRVAMTDPDPDLQEEAVEKLAEFDPAAALPRLEQLVWEHPRLDVREEAVEALAALPADLALPALDEIVMGHEDGPVVHEAIQAIAEFPSSVSMPRLLRILREHPLEDARHEALDQLADMRESE